MRCFRRHHSVLAFWLGMWWLLLVTLTPLASSANAGTTATAPAYGAAPICTVTGLHLPDADDAPGTFAQPRAGQHCLLCLGVDLPPTSAAAIWRLPTPADLPARPDRLLPPKTDTSRWWTLRRKQSPPVLPG